jgi:3-phosphoshikimate 1-carboxyvinyltransferase
MRMFAPIAALHNEMLTITGSGSLLKRPLGGVETVFTQLGINCTTQNGFLPLVVKGPLKGGSISMDASLTSQLLTGLLMALPLAANDSEIRVLNLKSKPYIDMTIALLSQFGIEITHNDYSRFQIKGGQQYLPTCYTVEGDWSGAAFLLVAGALNGSVTVTNLAADSFQADKLICEALQLAGAHVYVSDNCVVEKNELRAFHFDAGECPDLVPPLAALAAHCKGTTLIRGASRLKHKESNRATALQEEFAKLGVKIVIQDDVMMIEGGIVQGGVVHAHNDHRIAMALATAAVVSCNPVTIEGADCINKSYPNFFHDLKTLNIHCHYE